jgi:aspartyl protease family protein
MLIQSVLANFERSDNIQIVSSVIVIAMLVASLLSRKHHSNQPLLKYAFYWLLIICVGIFLYSFKDGYENIKERFMTALIPSRAVDTGGEITIKKSVNGHFLVDAFVNDKPVKFLIDTGASSVVLSLEDAKKVGVDIENLSFNRIVQTASGQGKVANTQVNIKIGDFVVEDLPVLVNSAPENVSLLGMSLINRFKSFEVNGDTLIFRY